MPLLLRPSGEGGGILGVDREAREGVSRGVSQGERVSHGERSAEDEEYRKLVKQRSTVNPSAPTQSIGDEEVQPLYYGCSTGAARAWLVEYVL